MEKLTVKYSTASRAMPPQRIKLELPGWAGDPAHKMVDGAPIQPWHCKPFAEGSTYGLELIYQHEHECHIINDDPQIRIEWDFYKEPAEDVTGGEFLTFFPKEASQQYLFSTRIDIQAPPGHVARIEPHPRFFTDTTGTVPVAIISNVQTQWWSKWFFVVFKVPPPGQRHIFRRGEPFAQVIFVPQRVNYDIVRMTPEEEALRRDSARKADVARVLIGNNVWTNSGGGDQSNYYKVLAAAFERDGQAGVDQLINRAMEQHYKQMPSPDMSTAQILALGAAHMAEHRYDEGRDVFATLVMREPENALARANYGICIACLGAAVPGIRSIEKAIELEPRNPAHQITLGQLYRLLRSFQDSETAFRDALKLSPDNPDILSLLSRVIAEQERHEEAIELADRALAIAPHAAALHLGKGLILEKANRLNEARNSVEAALKANPDLTEAQLTLDRLNAATHNPPPTS